VEKLETLDDRPLMMLGKIQSGKTRSFIGVISLAFDNGYDFAIVLTKNSNALAKQTTFRMKAEFKCFIEEDMLDVFDIMCVPQNLSKFELDKKLIFVVKKQHMNLPKLQEFIKSYSIIDKKKCLIIDDEADFTSVGYNKKRDSDSFDLRRIADQINSLRLNLECRFIQVTATPYSLYLQPENIILGEEKIIKPVRPVETVLVPHGETYIGGDQYFNRELHPLGEYLFSSVQEDELQILKSNDRRKFKIEDALTSNKIQGLRTAIINYLVAACIRIIQNGGSNKGRYNKFSFIIHTQIAKTSHNRQENLITELINQLEAGVGSGDKLVDQYIEESYKQIKESVIEYGFKCPELDQVKLFVKRAIEEEWLTKVVVNSERDINTLLNDEGQLKLRSPLNIFIGGQILDRGITISNLIGFYYGRSPKKMQQDTVLQHSRMYGYRSLQDLSVTRFYTTNAIYNKMNSIYEFDSKLREDFEEGNFDNGVVFISKDQYGEVIPCSPQKIIISNTQVLKPGKTTTVFGFQTKYKSYIKKDILYIDELLKKHNQGNIEGKFKISKHLACELIGVIYSSFELERDKCIDQDAFISLINYLSKNEVNVYVGTDRNISRLRKTSRYYSDMPYNRDRDLYQAKKMAVSEPTLMLMRQNGREELGWRGAEFYWPVLVTPKNIETAVYTSELIK